MQSPQGCGELVILYFIHILYISLNYTPAFPEDNLSSDRSK
jgi:hypothetical protein